MLTKDQISGITDRVAIALCAWLVARGYITQGDAANVVTAIVAVVGAAWGYYVNRPKAIVQSAAAVPGTTVVTTPALAAATPESNIVSNATEKVVPK